MNRQAFRRDDGVGMILVIALSVFIFGLVVTGAMMASNSLALSRHRGNFEAALSAAESGIDQTLGQLQAAYDLYAADFPVPALASSNFPDPVCDASPVAQPEDFATAQEEETWATTAIQALVASHPECITTTESGQFIVLKPATPKVDGRYPGFGRVYAMGWAPSRAVAGGSSRLVKVEYVFLPYTPQQAILTNGNLALSSSTLVSTAAGYDASLAAVHSNGTISTTGNPTVYGMVTSVGDSSASSNNFYANPGGAVTEAPTVAVPRVSARSFYFNAPNSDAVAVSSRWYDLCPDGTVKAWSSAGPCSGEVKATSAAIGWAYENSTRTWVASRNSVPGVFYVHEGNVDVGTGNAVIPYITVIASSRNANDCGTKQYGNIRWDHYEMANPGFRNLFLYADADIETFSNFTAGDRGTGGTAVSSGMFVAGDQISMQTSSQGAVGSVVAADKCSTSPMVTSNEVKNPAVYFDPDGDSPFTDIINTTLWLEYDAA
jgi:hypothetical protein